MLFSEELKKTAAPIIDDIYNDSFIQDLLHGQLPYDATKYYLRADASYLKEFANIYALLIPKMPELSDVKFLVEQIQFIVDGEVEAHEILANYVQAPYDEIVQEQVWPPSGDHYIKHMYYNAFAKENAAYTIAAMAPCPYVYQVVANRALQDSELNTDSILKQWFDFYSTEMDELVKVFDDLMDKLTEHVTNEEKSQIAETFLQSTIHERNFFAMSYKLEAWSFGGDNHE
ncbi:thiaminase II [Staphylococcus gallinarum]|uniref:Aminopyrimidine aminohydrolase n=1 Tax=Staphylococcus gallinarum TaxID=1293 RepID=A0A3A0VZ98_STAGA|nr:thiaminase II [Staphylococcus gallinarum]RIP32925.1 thiaminase II [Staphylococcus gallinarum]